MARRNGGFIQPRERASSYLGGLSRITSRKAGRNFLASHRTVAVTNAQLVEQTTYTPNHAVAAQRGERGAGSGERETTMQGCSQPRREGWGMRRGCRSATNLAPPEVVGASWKENGGGRVEGRGRITGAAGLSE